MSGIFILKPLSLVMGDYEEFRERLIPAGARTRDRYENDVSIPPFPDVHPVRIVLMGSGKIRLKKLQKHPDVLRDPNVRSKPCGSVPDRLAGSLQHSILSGNHPRVWKWPCCYVVLYKQPRLCYSRALPQQGSR